MSEKRDFSDIGMKIKAVLQDAAETGDFGRVNQVINETVSSAMEEVRHQVNEAHRRMNGVGTEGTGAGSAGKQTGQSREAAGGRQSGSAYAAGSRQHGTAYTAGTRSGEGTDYAARYRSRIPRYPKRQENGQRQYDEAVQEYRTTSGVPVYGNQTEQARIFRPNGKVAGILYTVFGSIGLGTFGILALICMLMWVSPYGTGFGGATAIFGALTGASGLMLGKGCNLQARIKRAQRYLTLAQRDMYMKLEELAAHTGQGVRRVRRDVRRMLQAGIFPQGHLDEKETFLILDNETWEQYLIEKKEYQESQRIADADRAKAADTAQAEDTVNAKQQQEQEIERDGQAFMERLRELNVEIPGEVISNKLYQLDYLLQRIFMVLKEHPEKCPQMRKFMDYYLPTTVKLVESYADFDKAGVQGENIKTAKAEIEKAMETINQAFEKLLDDIYRDAAFEAAADAKVLKTVLAQDGYMKSEFTTDAKDFGMQEEGEK